MKTTIKLLVAFSCIANVAFAQGSFFDIFFVKDVNHNADIYCMNSGNPSVVRRLTTDSATDNHADFFIQTSAPFDTMVVWSSNRGGNFELYFGTLPDLEATKIRITNNNFADRHPHFSPDGTKIIYTAKYRFESATVCPKDECSIPVSEPCGWYEGLRIMTVGTWTISDFDFRNMTIIGGGTWPNLFSTWIGHPSFSEDGSKILFSAALDEGGTDWETYFADFSPPNNISNLTQITLGSNYPASPNPIQMTAGAHFVENDSKIIYSSTRTPLGNSQLFVVPSASVAVPVDPSNQVTWNYGNDYVPDELENEKILFTSDLGPNSICLPPDTGATDDLDLFLMNSDGSGRINLTDNDSVDEMLLIGDEVSWFCGIKPNLSECTFFPKTWNVCWFRELHQMGTDPLYLPTFPKRNLYTESYKKVCAYMNMQDPLYLSQIFNEMFYYWLDCDTSWEDAPSWWTIPSIFGRWDTSKPASPALISPLNKATLDSTKITFDFTDVPAATGYKTEISKNPNFVLVEIVSLSLQSQAPITVTTSGRYYWRAGAIKGSDTTYSTVWYFDLNPLGVKEIGNNSKKFLFANPNPFSEKTRINFSLANEDDVKIVIYDVMGKEIQLLLNKHLPLGMNSVEWNGKDFPNGIYFYKMQTKKFTATEKIILMK